MSLVHLDHLTVDFAGRRAVDDVSIRLDRGESLALVGESGSGKSVTARTLVGLAGEGAVVRAGQAVFDGVDLLRLRDKDWRSIRGNRIGFVLQDALVSLDPIRPIGKEINEALRIHTNLTRAERDKQVIELLGSVGVPQPEWRATQLPSQLSGGLRQRALIASALAGNPDLIIADEPTTALDVTVQAQILDLLGSLMNDNRALLIISHDLAVVSRIAHRVAVLKSGRIVEEGNVRQVFDDPQHEYTKALLQAVPSAHAKGSRLSPQSGAPIPAPAGLGPVVVSAHKLTKTFAGPAGSRHTAVNDVSFELRTGETLGIVGESGSGKTTTGRIIMGLETADSGDVAIVEADGTRRDWKTLDRRQRRGLRRQAQTIYQDPSSSFDPRYSVRRIIGEAVAVTGRFDKVGADQRTRSLLALVGLHKEFLDRRPTTLSGGQRQRVAIARALATEPRLILLDEPVSALDVSIQAQVLDLLADIQAATGVAFIFISHDLGVIYHVSDRVLVMKDGDVVEEGDVESIFSHPSHPYTQQLLRSIPRLTAELENENV
jgi:peptide/nickel transport system ATP-binding protein